MLKETREGSPGVVEAVTSSSVIRLDEEIGPSRGGTMAVVSEGNVSNDRERSTRRSSRNGSCCESLVVRGGRFVKATADEGLSCTERRAIRSGCVPTDV